MTVSRRSFLKTTCYLTIGFCGLKNYVHAQSSPSSSPMATAVGYGPLIPDPNKILDLPQGFSYQVIAHKGQKLSDGFFLPAKPDGMAAFSGNEGTVVLVMNHELGVKNKGPSGPFGKGNELLTDKVKPYLYDNGHKRPMLGGTSTLVYDPKKKEVQKHFLSLTGTERNCAGGPSPWGTWITCEETDDIREGDKWAADHGYNFEVPAKADSGLITPTPLKAMGRFRHEAVAVDPRNSIVYQTEDLGDGLIYRFIPNKAQDLAAGGKLQALALKGKKPLDTRNWDGPAQAKEGEPLEVEWIDLEDVEAQKQDLRKQGQEKGAAIFARGEGMWFGKNEVFWACTNGGAIKQGQIFRYVPSPHEGTADESKAPGKLELFLESTDGEVLSFADNLTVAEWGDLYIAEDPYGARNAKLVGITPEGKCYDVGKNSYNESELAGACFSPDHKVLFVNIQSTGLTLAITGPWEDRKV